MTVGANGLLSQRTLAASLFYTYDLGGDVAQRWGTAGYNDYAFDAYGRRAVTLSGDYYTGCQGQWGINREERRATRGRDAEDALAGGRQGRRGGAAGDGAEAGLVYGDVGEAGLSGDVEGLIGRGRARAQATPRKPVLSTAMSAKRVSAETYRVSPGSGATGRRGPGGWRLPADCRARRRTRRKRRGAARRGRRRGGRG